MHATSDGKGAGHNLQTGAEHVSSSHFPQSFASRIAEASLVPRAPPRRARPRGFALISHPLREPAHKRGCGGSCVLQGSTGPQPRWQARQGGTERDVDRYLSSIPERMLREAGYTKCEAKCEQREARTARPRGLSTRIRSQRLDGPPATRPPLGKFRSGMPPGSAGNPGHRPSSATPWRHRSRHAGKSAFCRGLRRPHQLFETVRGAARARSGRRR